MQAVFQFEKLLMKSILNGR